MPLALVEPIRRAIKEDRVTTLARTVALLGESGAFENDLFLDPNAERYARRLIWRDPDDRFVGVEIVVRGTMMETAYRICERDAFGRIRFERERDRVCEEGSAGVLVPPHDHHVFGNIGSTTAHTIHVYGGAFARSTMFVPEADGFCRQQVVTLGYDA
jgi:hypothetical protein